MILTIGLSSLVLASLVFGAKYAKKKEADKARKPAANKIDYVQECLELLMEHGTDRYGEKHAPILVSILGVESRTCPENPEKLDEQWRVTRRGRRNPAGANMLMDMPTLKTMFLLSKVTGNDKYAKFARTYIDYYMKNLVDDKNLFWWGWHRHYDVYREEMTGHAGNHHELHSTHCIAWDKLWAVNPEAVQKEIEAIWQWHVVDKESGEVDRHDSGSRGCDFSMSSGSFIHAFAFLYTKTKEKVWLDRAKLLAIYYWDRRNKKTNLFPDQPNAGKSRFDGSHFVTAITGLHCHALLKSYEMTGVEMFKDYAMVYLKAYGRYGFDEKTGKFWGSLNLDGTPVRGPMIRAGYAKYEPRGYLDLWEPYVLGYQYALYTAQAYAYAYHLTKEVSLLTTAKRFADWIEKNLPPRGCMKDTWYDGYAKRYAPHGTYAGKYGRTISFFIHLYVLTEDDKYLKLAREVANEAISKLYFKGLFRGHPAKPYYEATDGVGFLLYALLELDQVQRHPKKVLAKQTILIGKGSDESRIGLDNW